MCKKIQKKVDMLLSLIIIVVFVPLFITIIGQRMQLEELIYREEAPVKEESATEEHLIGIVAKEISADAPEEAILAQCVIARTNLYDAKTRQIAEPEALDIEEMQGLWGEHFEDCYRHLKECVERTKGEVLMWQGEYAYAAYHAVSAGSTRDMQELCWEAQMPYLKVQECAADTVAEGYLAVSYWEEEKFIEECNHLFVESGVKSCEEIVIESRDSAGYVLAMKIGQTDCNGEKFREAFGLNSACFAITELDGCVRIVTKGLGHGFGLSQNMANEMAKEGADYKKILTYFFPGTELSAVESGK